MKFVNGDKKIGTVSITIIARSWVSTPFWDISTNWQLHCKPRGIKIKGQPNLYSKWSEQVKSSFHVHSINVNVSFNQCCYLMFILINWNILFWSFYLIRSIFFKSIVLSFAVYFKYIYSFFSNTTTISHYFTRVTLI